MFKDQGLSNEGQWDSFFTVNCASKKKLAACLSIKGKEELVVSVTKALVSLLSSLWVKTNLNKCREWRLILSRAAKAE